MNLKKYILLPPFPPSFYPLTQQSLSRGLPVPLQEEDEHLKHGSHQEGGYPGRERQKVNIPKYLCWGRPEGRNGQFHSPDNPAGASVWRITLLGIRITIRCLFLMCPQATGLTSCQRGESGFPSHSPSIQGTTSIAVLTGPGQLFFLRENTLKKSS